MKIERPKSNQPIPDHAKKVFEGVLFDVYQWPQEMYDGTTQTFERLKRADVVVVFGVLPDGKILMADQEQPGRDPYVGAIAGRMEKGEEVIDAAKREFREETGYEADKYILIDAKQTASKIDWVVYTFIAKGLRKVGEQELDGGEKIKLRSVTFDELLEMADKSFFPNKELALMLLAAKSDSAKMTELRKLFDPKL
ncbi:MAG: NUDIX hydrolase [Patescibacteria group bacterium]